MSINQFDDIDKLINDLFNDCYDATRFQAQREHFRDRALELNGHPGLGCFVANL